MLKIYDRYLLRQLLVSTLVITGGLSMIILLTQSLRLIELVLESNASSQVFLTLMGLSVPRFIEAVLPASVLIAVLFVFHRLSVDSEMIVLRASGASPWRLAKPVMTMGGILIAALLILSLWLSPMGISKMQMVRKEIRNQYAHLLFKEGIFNTVGQNLTAYVRQRALDGRLVGLMVHDTRGLSAGEPAVTIVARSGNIVNEGEGQKIIVYDGSRQERDVKTGKFSRLDFQQYTLEIPTGQEDTSVRWREPDERTIGELTDKAELAKSVPEDRLQFRAELHRRFSTPLLMFSFALIAATFMLQTPYARSGNLRAIVTAALTGIILQGAYLATFSIAKKSLIGCLALYGIAALPILISFFMLTPAGEAFLTKTNRMIKHARDKWGPT